MAFDDYLRYIGNRQMVVGPFIREEIGVSVMSHVAPTTRVRNLLQYEYLEPALLSRGP